MIFLWGKWGLKLSNSQIKVWTQNKFGQLYN